MTQAANTPILLVDDRPENLLALEGLLEGLGLRIFKAFSGNEALRLALKNDFALVLLDVRMPDMDGFETAELMRANHKTRNVPIIFVSAALKDSDHQFKGYETGAVDYLLKPIAPAIVRSKVKIFCDLYRQRRQIEVREQRLEGIIKERTSDLKASNEQLNEELAVRKRLQTRERTRAGALEKLIRGEALSEVLNSIALGLEAEQKQMLVSILELDAEEGRLRHCAAPSLPKFYTDAIDGLQIGPEAGSCGAAAYSGQRVIAEDIRTDPNWRLHRDLASRAGLASCWSEPIVNRQGRVIGTVAIYHRQPASPRPEDLELIQALASLSGVAIEHRQAEEEIRKLNAELEERVERRTREISLLNRALQERARALEQSNKELESFSYSIAHDLRTPLRSIAGFSHLLVKDYADKLEAEGRDYLKTVDAAARRMGQLIDDLLGLLRVARCEIHRAPVDLSALAETIAGELKLAHPEREVRVTIPPGLKIEADANLLRTVLAHLFENAWKFTGKQPVARIELGSVGQEGQEGQTTYFIRDNGAGFNMAYAAKLFAPFQRLHPPGEFPGAGIGLATVRRIIQKHGGRVWAEGEEGKGATIYFTLPPPTTTAN
jgi:signal transduction histidine kinase/DNA-binding response OmpR family regulator